MPSNNRAMGSSSTAPGPVKTPWFCCPNPGPQIPLTPHEICIFSIRQPASPPCRTIGLPNPAPSLSPSVFPFSLCFLILEFHFPMSPCPAVAFMSVSSHLARQLSNFSG